MSPPTILVRQAAHVVHDGHRHGLLTSWLRWKRDRHLATAANRRVSCALQRRNECLHRPSSFYFHLFCVSIVAWDEQVQNAGGALSSSRTYSCVERRRVPSACYHRPPPTMHAQLPYVRHPSLLLKLSISSCRMSTRLLEFGGVRLMINQSVFPYGVKFGPKTKVVYLLFVPKDLPSCIILSMQAGTSRDLPICTNLDMLGERNLLRIIRRVPGIRAQARNSRMVTLTIISSSHLRRFSVASREDACPSPLVASTTTPRACMIVTWVIIHHPWDIMSNRWTTLVSTPGSPPSKKDSRRSGILFTNTLSGKKKQDNASPPSTTTSSNRRMTIETGCSKVLTSTPTSLKDHSNT